MAAARAGGAESPRLSLPLQCPSRDRRLYQRSALASETLQRDRPQIGRPEEVPPRALAGRSGIEVALTRL
jgi:hypothetical protein